jgi:hypothetical protein
VFWIRTETFLVHIRSTHRIRKSTGMAPTQARNSTLGMQDQAVQVFRNVDVDANVFKFEFTNSLRLTYVQYRTVSCNGNQKRSVNNGKI